MGRATRRGGRSMPAPLGAQTAFDQHLIDLLGEECAALEEALTRPAPTSFRVNTSKWAGPDAERIPWCNTGYYLDQRPAFTFDPLLHAGCYYVQEASSMLVEQAIKAAVPAGRDLLALDLCAAPGGKSTHLRALLSPGSLLVANEFDRKRQPILLENLWKWGASNTVITGSAPSDLDRLPHFFDLILVDAPCSGEGMFRKDPFARQQWSPALVAHCAATQQHILEQAWNALAPGGTLIYSTCTWQTTENEAQVARLMVLGGTCVPIPVQECWGVVVTEELGIHGLRCYPHRVKGEGLFIAMVRKPGLAPDRRAGVESGAKIDEEQSPLRWLDQDRAWSLLEHDQVFFGLEQRWAETVQRITGQMHMLSPGIPVAERKGHELKPHSALALSSVLDRSSFNMVELDLAQALDYLRGNSMAAREAHGAALAMYKGIGLGWLHGAGNRWNNRWPTPWRIRSKEARAAHVSWSRT